MMMRTIEPGITVFTAAEIRVAVLPVGKVPRDIYDEYSDLINQHRHVSLSAAHSFYRETQKSPFQYMPWTTGLLHMRFLRDEDAFRRTRMVDLHSQRQVLAVIGIVYGGASPDLSAAYQEFIKVNRQFPEAFTNRCLVFEPTEQQIQQDTRDFKDLIIFPPGDVSAPTQHLEVVMHDMAAAILSEVEKWMLSASPNMMKLNTYVDSGEFTGQLAVLDDLNKFRMQFTEEEIKEKRKWARLQKAKGDMCLLAGSPRDAYDNYKSALELCKVTGDAVWYAAAEEGVAHARIIEALANSTAFTQPSSPVMSSDGDAFAEQPASEASMMKAAAVGFGGKEVWNVLREANLEQEVRELFTDARQWYKRKGGAISLQIEQQLKLARFLAGLKGLSARKEVSEMMSFVMEQVPSLPLHDDRLVAMVEAAQVMGLVGSSRKRALMLWQAVEQARTMEKSETAALKIAIKALEPPDDPHQQDPDDFPRLHWTQRRGGVPHSWEAVHMASLEGALQAARQARSPAEAWEAAAALLREHHHMISGTVQTQLMDQLSQAAAAMSTSLRVRAGAGPGPHICLNRILQCPPALQPVTVTGRTADLEDPFIFNPYANKKKETTFSNPEWVCGDDCWVEVLVSNPTAVTMKLDRINLHVKYHGVALKQGAPRPWQALPVSLELPPNCKPQRHHLNVKLLQAGRITLLGCQVSMWGVQWAQPFSPPPKRAAGSGPPPPRPARKNGATGLEALATVEVLPFMPLLRATVRSPDFQHTQPSEALLQKPYGLPGDAQSKTAAIPVLEGQLITWSLTLTNIGQEPATACKVVVGDSKQALPKGSAGSRSLSHFTGVMADVDMTALTAALPLKPLDTVTVPLKLQIGRAPENFDEVTLELQITYMHDINTDDAKTPDDAKPTKSLHARCLSLTLCLQIQPTLQISAVRFLELNCPVVDGSRVLPADPQSLSRALQMYMEESKSKQSGVGAGSGSNSQSASPKKKGMDSAGKGKGRFGALVGSQDTPLSEVLIRGADLPADKRVSLSQQCVMQLTVSNTCSDRYFKAWVAPAQSDHDPSLADSAVSVIQPGEPSTLLTVLTRQDTQPKQPSSPLPQRAMRPGQKAPTHEDLCAQYLLGRCAVFWEMITVKQSNEKAPQGVLLLPQSEVAKSLLPASLGMLRPRHLHISFSAVNNNGTQCTLTDLSEQLQAQGLMPEDLVGQVWGVQLQEGGTAVMELHIMNHCTHRLKGALNIAMPAAGILLSGVFSKLRFDLQPGASTSHRLAVLVASPGLHVLDIKDVEWDQSSMDAVAEGTVPLLMSQEGSASSILGVSQDKFLLYCASCN